jgi:hypothetical protein
MEVGNITSVWEFVGSRVSQGADTTAVNSSSKEKANKFKSLQI